MDVRRPHPAPTRKGAVRLDRGGARICGHGKGDDERERLAATFDTASDLYQRARPEYPDALYERLLEVTGLCPGASLLEVGCATGKATLPLARRGFAVTCLEPGASLGAGCQVTAAGRTCRPS